MRLELADLVPVEDPDAVGDLRAWADVDLPGLDRAADLSVWLPPGYDSAERASQRYPVVYLHDGGNLFLESTSFDGTTWRVGEAMTALAAEGIEAIVVGVPCHPDKRWEEYTQYAHPEHGGGRGEEYAAFLTDHLKPAIDAVLRTDPGPESTVTAGSSLGGVISAYLWQTRPEVYGGAGLFSTAFWFPGERAIADLENTTPHQRVGARVYLDVGGREGDEGPEIQQAYVADTERAHGGLRRAGVPTRYVYDSTAIHHESAWAERFPAAMRWLLRSWQS
ncbi:alpha/beta hydrolase [Salana multivorans]